MKFTKSTASSAAWDLAGFHGITDERLRTQAKGLSLIDAEFGHAKMRNPYSACGTSAGPNERPYGHREASLRCMGMKPLAMGSAAKSGHADTRRHTSTRR